MAGTNKMDYFVKVPESDVGDLDPNAVVMLKVVDLQKLTSKCEKFGTALNRMEKKMDEVSDIVEDTRSLVTGSNNTPMSNEAEQEDEVGENEDGEKSNDDIKRSSSGSDSGGHSRAPTPPLPATMPPHNSDGSTTSPKPDLQKRKRKRKNVSTQSDDESVASSSAPSRSKRHRSRKAAKTSKHKRPLPSSSSESSSGHKHTKDQKQRNDYDGTAADSDTASKKVPNTTKSSTAKKRQHDSRSKSLVAPIKPNKVERYESGVDGGVVVTWSGPADQHSLFDEQKCLIFAMDMLQNMEIGSLKELWVDGAIEQPAMAELFVNVVNQTAFDLLLHTSNQSKVFVKDPYQLAEDNRTLDQFVDDIPDPGRSAVKCAMRILFKEIPQNDTTLIGRFSIVRAAAKDLEVVLPVHQERQA